ncbi:MAG: DUF433 domain-containing protein [Deltaproteobacteria bacterium]|nr:DUF433 domain-containing protein [Deltaproteobacteria bacterium]
MPAIVLAPRIVANPEILGGRVIIEGTRLSVEFILGQLGRGLAVDEVVTECGVPCDDVLAAVRFAANTVGWDAYLAPER